MGEAVDRDVGAHEPEHGLDVGSGFRLVLDTGTFHGLTDAQREAMGREVTAIATPDATLVLACFAPRRRGPLPVARAAPTSSGHSATGS